MLMTIYIYKLAYQSHGIEITISTNQKILVLSLLCLMSWIFGAIYINLLRQNTLYFTKIHIIWIKIDVYKHCGKF